jgi:hypothetical protein
MDLKYLTIQDCSPQHSYKFNFLCKLCNFKDKNSSEKFSTEI